LITHRAQQPPTLIYSILFIAITIALSMFLVWAVNTDLVLKMIAGAMTLVITFVGAAAGWCVYSLLSTGNLPHWARLTVSIILGLAISVATMELTHSHKLIRYYQYYEISEDE